jgi:hypothetical protein
LRWQGLLVLAAVAVVSDSAVLRPLVAEARPARAVAAAPPPASGELGCFEAHLREAIEENKKRQPVYSALSEGASEPVSRLLIRSEKLLLPLARRLDEKARLFRRAGLGVLCDEFVAMSHAPAMILEKGPSPSGAVEQSDLWVGSRPAPRWAKRIRRALKDSGIPGALEAAKEALGESQSYPQYLCMARHILESIGRAAALAPKHEAQAKILKLRSPMNLSVEFISLQILGLRLSTRLDGLAYRLQKQGIPIICGDVPPIPIPSVSGS